MIHLSRSLLCCSLALSLAAVPAFARDATKVPPSGITIHLFGPTSVTSQIMSTLPGAGSSHAGNTATGGTVAGGGATSGGTAGAANASDNAASDSPTWHDVVHQMFVVGDPAQEGAAALSKGKSGGP
jgi:hypothetical protein